MLLTLSVDLFCLQLVLEGLILEGLLCDVVLEGHVFEGVLNVEHGGLVHVEERVEHFLFVFQFGSGGPQLVVSGRVEQSFILDEGEEVEVFPLGRGLLFFWLGEGVELKVLHFEVEFVEHELLDALGVDFIEFGDQTSCDQSVLQSQPHLFAVGEDQLVQVIEDELQRLRIRLVYFHDLADAAGVERLVLYVTEVTKNLLDLLLHSQT